MPRNEDRHRYPGHYVRIPEHVWVGAQVRARNESYGEGIRDLIHGLLAAYAARAIDAPPIAAHDPAHEGTPMTTTVKLFAISMADVGSMVSQSPDGPYRKVVEVEKFGDVYRIWMEPVPGDDGAPEYLDGAVGSSLWQPHAPAELTPAGEARAEREYEVELDAAAGRIY